MSAAITKGNGGGNVPAGTTLTRALQSAVENILTVLKVSFPPLDHDLILLNSC
jgi:hypothetical protein